MAAASKAFRTSPSPLERRPSKDSHWFTRNRIVQGRTGTGVTGNIPQGRHYQIIDPSLPHLLQRDVNGRRGDTASGVNRRNHRWRLRRQDISRTKSIHEMNRHKQDKRGVNAGSTRASASKKIKTKKIYRRRPHRRPHAQTDAPHDGLSQRTHESTARQKQTLTHHDDTR